MVTEAQVEQVAFLEHLLKQADVTSHDSGWASNPPTTTPTRSDTSGDIPEPAEGTVSKRLRRKLGSEMAAMVGPGGSGTGAPGPAQPAPPTPAAATTNTGSQGGPAPAVSDEDYQWMQSLGQRRPPRNVFNFR